MSGIEIAWVAIVFGLGACVGSFLNVCILRLPREEDLVFKRSYCYGCATRIAWFDLMPILSWFVLRGRTRCCKQPFSFRYPAVELLTALAFVLCWLRLEPASACAMMLFTSLLMVAFWVDYDHLIIPDSCTIGGALLGLWLSFFIPSLHGIGSSGLWLTRGTQSVSLALMGLFIGSGLLLWIAILAELALKKEAIGFGDVKLMGCIGAFCGWKGAVFSIFGGALLGTLSILSLYTARWILYRVGHSKTAPGSLDRQAQIPFGPFLAVAAWVYALFLAPWMHAHPGQLFSL